MAMVGRPDRTRPARCTARVRRTFTQHRQLVCSRPAAAQAQDRCPGTELAASAAADTQQGMAPSTGCFPSGDKDTWSQEKTSHLLQLLVKGPPLVRQPAALQLQLGLATTARAAQPAARAAAPALPAQRAGHVQGMRVQQAASQCLFSERTPVAPLWRQTGLLPDRLPGLCTAACTMAATLHAAAQTTSPSRALQHRWPIRMKEKTDGKC